MLIIILFNRNTNFRVKIIECIIIFGCSTEIWEHIASSNGGSGLLGASHDALSVFTHHLWIHLISSYY